MKDFIKPTLVLVLVGIAAAGLLAFVYNLTIPEIEKRAKESLQSSLSMVFPVSDVEFEAKIKDTLWIAKKDNKIEGIVFVNTYKGYSGLVKVIVGVDINGNILKVYVPKDGLTETPGLGMKVAEEFFLKQFTGLVKDDIYLTKDGGKIDGITAATISSRAVVNAVRFGIEKYLPLVKEMKTEKWYEKRLKELFAEDSIKSLSENVWEISDKKIIVYYAEEEGYGDKLGVLVVIKDDKIEKIILPTIDEGFSETEGIGSLVCDDKYLRKFIGKNPKEVMGIDGITNATITSNALKKAIYNGYIKLRSEK